MFILFHPTGVGTNHNTTVQAKGIKIAIEGRIARSPGRSGRYYLPATNQWAGMKELILKKREMCLTCSNLSTPWPI